MANVNVVTISGMFGNGKTYFADSPVVITISGLQWPASSPFDVVYVEVLRGGSIIGTFRADTGGQSSISFDISSALRTIWSDYDYTGNELAAAQSTVISLSNPNPTSAFYERAMRSYTLRIHTEYMSSDDGGVFTTTQCAVEIGGRQYTDIPGGQCLMGGMTEWERSIRTDEQADVSSLEHSNHRNGDASTKPVSTPERVGSTSITSWVDVQTGKTKSMFFPYTATAGEDSDLEHAPLVVRDSQPYIDFLFINRRGAIETCSGLTKEAMAIGTSTQQYSRSEGPSFRPSRSLMAIGTDGRRSWPISSGYVTREWAEWWTMEFLGGKRKQWWMLWQGPGLSAPRYVPVIVKPAKNDTSIYDKSKQQALHVDFTVTLALEG